MNEILQWIAVALAVAAATIYLIKRLARSKECGGCGHCCNSCPYGEEFVEKCANKPD